MRTSYRLEYFGTHRPQVDRYTANVTQQRRVAGAIGLNVVIIAVQIVFGLVAHSLGLIADAGHNVGDVAALVLSLVALRLSARKPDAQRSFGFHRSGVLAAQANAISILVAGAVITYEAIRRLGHTTQVRGGVVIVVALIALVANGLAARLLHIPHGGARHQDNDHDHGHAHDDERSQDLNMESAFLHMVGDAAASLGVVIAGVIIVISHGSYWLDPAVSIAVAALISWRAIGLLRQTNRVLMEASSAGRDARTLADVMMTVDGVAGVHDVHSWSLSGNLHAMSAHVVIDGHPSLDEAQVVVAKVRQTVMHGAGMSHATFELECGDCVAHDVDCVLAPLP